MSAAKKQHETAQPKPNHTTIVLLMVFVLGLATLVIIGRANFSLKYDGNEVGLIAAENARPGASVVPPTLLTPTPP